MANEEPSTTNLITEITSASVETNTTTTVPTNPNSQQNDDVVNSLASSSSSMSRAPSPPPPADTDNTSHEEAQGGGEELPCTTCGQIGHVSRYCPDQVCENCELPGHARVDCIGCLNCGSHKHFLPDCHRLDQGKMDERQNYSDDDDGSSIGDGTYYSDDDDGSSIGDGTYFEDQDL